MLHHALLLSAMQEVLVGMALLHILLVSDSAHVVMSTMAHVTLSVRPHYQGGVSRRDEQ